MIKLHALVRGEPRLTDKCVDFVGQNVFVLPYYGYGWVRADLNEPGPGPLARLGPEPFHATIAEFVSCGGSLVGATGTIKELGHELHGYWCSFFLRSTESADFRDRPGDYMIWISPRKLPVEPNPQKGLYEWVKFDKALPCLCGYGMVAEDPEKMGKTYDITMTTRKQEIERSRNRPQ